MERSRMLRLLANALFKRTAPNISYMKHSLKTGFSFGMTSAIITTLGLMVGLNSGTHSRIAVLGGILTIAIADAFSDSLGIHISEESEDKHSSKEIWESTVFTFLTKFVFAMTFIIPVLLFQLQTAVAINVVWGLSLLVVMNFGLARSQGKKPWKIIGEHVMIAALVIVIAHYVGLLIAAAFV